MYPLRKLTGLLATLILGGLMAGALPADDAPKAAETGLLLVTDNAGKEQKLKTWKFVQGTRHLAWLAPAEVKEKEPEDKDGDDGKNPPRKGIRPRAQGRPPVPRRWNSARKTPPLTRRASSP